MKLALGLLIRGSVNETMKRLAGLIDKMNPPKIVSVGDVVSGNMVRHGIHPHTLIVDNRVMRKRVEPFTVDVKHILHVKNPPGTLTKEARSTVRKVLRQRQPTKIIVDGEEDLLTLAAVLYAPENSFVVYGQPHEGIVVVRVTKKKKESVRKIVEAMKTSKS